MATDHDVQQARARVQEGHARVSRGEYPGAARAFAEGLVVLRDALGVEHPEVQELMEDLRTVHDMAGVADFLGAAGLRMPGDLPEPPTRPGSDES